MPFRIYLGTAGIGLFLGSSLFLHCGRLFIWPSVVFSRAGRCPWLARLARHARLVLSRCAGGWHFRIRSYVRVASLARGAGPPLAGAKAFAWGCRSDRIGRRPTFAQRDCRSHNGQLFCRRRARACARICLLLRASCLAASRPVASVRLIHGAAMGKRRGLCPKRVDEAHRIGRNLVGCPENRPAEIYWAISCWPRYCYWPALRWTCWASPILFSTPTVGH